MLNTVRRCGLAGITNNLDLTGFYRICTDQFVLQGRLHNLIENHSGLVLSSLGHMHFIEHLLHMVRGDLLYGQFPKGGDQILFNLASVSYRCNGGDVRPRIGVEPIPRILGKGMLAFLLDAACQKICDFIRKFLSSLGSDPALFAVNHNGLIDSVCHIRFSFR